MRIVAGQWRGRLLAAPSGITTRPTSDRARQALFDMLSHAPWSGGLRGLSVLDAFAGTGALGLEALSRGAAQASFMENDRAAVAALRANIAACRAESQARVFVADACRPPTGTSCNLVFLDPPYHRNLVPIAIDSLGRAGWFTAGAMIVAELGRSDPVPTVGAMLADRVHGAARLLVWRY